MYIEYLGNGSFYLIWDNITLSGGHPIQPMGIIGNAQSAVILHIQELGVMPYITEIVVQKGNNNTIMYEPNTIIMTTIIVFFLFWDLTLLRNDSDL